MPIRSIRIRLTAGLLLLGALAACRGSDRPVSLDTSLRMVDCRFQGSGWIHLHLSPARSLASVLSAYQPVAGEGHGDALIRARESKGKFIPAGDGGYRIDIFLRADSFGARADEQLSLLVDSSGSAFIESRLPGVPPRRLDSGRCSAAAGV